MSIVESMENFHPQGDLKMEDCFIKWGKLLSIERSDFIPNPREFDEIFIHPMYDQGPMF